MEGTKEEKYQYLCQIIQDLDKEFSELKQIVNDDHIKQIERIEKKHQEEIERIENMYQERKENREKEFKENIDKCNELRCKFEISEEISQNDIYDQNNQNDNDNQNDNHNKNNEWLQKINLFFSPIFKFFKDKF